jgi:small-conductance mechanosensitive channel
MLLTKVYPALNVDVGVGYAVNTLINYALIVVGFFMALTALGVDLSALTVVLASLGVGIGFGLQTITENLISGFILLFGRSVKKGDIITAGDLYGRVEEVGARSVLVKTPDNYDLLIPSKEIVGSRIVNWSYHDSLVRLHIPVGVTYKANPREVESILKKAALEHDYVLSDPGPEVWLTEFGDSSVNFTLLVYFNCREITQERLTGQLNFIIWDHLHENDIEIPFPQRDVHLRSGEVAEPIARAVVEYVDHRLGSASTANGEASDPGRKDSSETDDDAETEEAEEAETEEAEEAENTDE